MGSVARLPRLAQPGSPTPRMRRIMQDGAELILRKEADLPSG